LQAIAALVGAADNWLHFLLGVGMIVAGVVFGRTMLANERTLARNRA